MIASTNPEQTREINTVLNTLKEKFGGERETFDAKELLSIINSVSIIHKIYHSNAILKDGREGLLVDTGAVFNLTGDKWVHRMATHVPEDMPIQYEKLQEPQGVMGVGKESSTATHVASVPVGMADQDIEPDDSFRYKATVISGSDVPALLGLNSMTASNGILDLRPGKMHFYTCEDPDAIEIKYTPGKEHLVARLKMSMARSGHLMLPCSQFRNPTPSPSRRTNFPYSSKQPSRSRSPVPTESNKRVRFQHAPMSREKLAVPVGLANSE